MGTPTRQPQATHRGSSAERTVTRPSFPPRTSSARQVDSETGPPLSASFLQPSELTAEMKPKLPRKVNSIQDLASRFPVPPGPASAYKAGDPKIEWEVSLNEFLKEQWQAQPSSGPAFHLTPEHPPTLVTGRSKMGLRREASFPSHERQVSRESKASDHSNKTVIQKLKGSHRNSSVESIRSNHSLQTVTSHPAAPPPNNGWPILNFRPSLWKHLDTTRDVLSINLFWPKKLSDLEDEDYDEPANIFPHDSMKPLLQFRNLRSLTLAGMERSYQRLIWHTVFLNPGLQNLTLEMALEPVIIKESLPKCVAITADWVFPTPVPGWGSTTYLGHHGEGGLHEEFGEGEYLDRQAIEQACGDVFGVHAPTEARMLRISRLSLMGFVVDAAPFFRWFDAATLRTVVLKDKCFDAGLVLPPAMRNRTHVLLGGGLVPKESVLAFGPGDAKIVTLSKGMVVDEEAVEMLRRPKQGGELKKKFSGILRKWQGKEREGKDGL